MTIRVIANYFGEPPKVFQPWLDSIAANPQVEFVFITDLDMTRYRVPRNLLVQVQNFEELKRKIQSKFPYPVRYERPWDFCAFKPLFGTIFADELVGADYWGWSDCDMIYGDLSPVLKLAEEGFDKIMPNGHFSLVKNVPEINQFIFNHRKSREAVALDEKGLSCYDERDFRFTVMHEYGARQASEVVPYIHLYPRWGHFSFNVSHACCSELGIRNDESRPVVFTWQRGNLVGHFAMRDHEVKSVPLAYVHFFKRNIADKCGELRNDGTCYLIEPNGVRELPTDFLPNYLQVRWINRPRMHWAYIRNRLNAKTVKGKLDRLLQKLGLEKSAAQRKDDIVFYPDC